MIPKLHPRDLCLPYDLRRRSCHLRQRRNTTRHRRQLSLMFPSHRPSRPSTRFSCLLCPTAHSTLLRSLCPWRRALQHIKPQWLHLCHGRLISRRSCWGYSPRRIRTPVQCIRPAAKLTAHSTPSSITISLLPVSWHTRRRTFTSSWTDRVRRKWLFVRIFPPSLSNIF